MRPTEVTLEASEEELPDTDCEDSTDNLRSVYVLAQPHNLKKSDTNKKNKIKNKNKSKNNDKSNSDFDLDTFFILHAYSAHTVRIVGAPLEDTGPVGDQHFN